MYPALVSTIRFVSLRRSRYPGIDQGWAHTHLLFLRPTSLHPLNYISSTCGANEDWVEWHLAAAFSVGCCTLPQNLYISGRLGCVPVYCHKLSCDIIFNMGHVIRAILLSLVAYQNSVAAQAEITEDSYFYGESPPVYPSRMYFLLLLN